MTNIIIGKVVALSGLRGWVRIHSYAEKPEDLGQFKFYYTKDARELELDRLLSTKGSFATLAFKNIKKAAEAEKLIGLELFIKNDQLPKLSEGEFYYKDLIGLEAFFDSGERAGQIINLINYGASDLLELLLDGVTSFYPFTKDFILEVQKDRVIVKKLESV